MNLQNRFCSILGSLGVGGIIATSLLAQPAAAAESLPSVSGAGSTWSQNALDQWRADVTRNGLQINYQGNGSTAGRSLLQSGQIDFAVSEIPFQPSETKPSFKFVYLPIVAGGTAVMYKVKGSDGKLITNLRLSPRSTALIFTRKVTKWNDAAIAADNPGVPLPNKSINVVVRSDGSGTSYQFSAFLQNQEPALWSEFARKNNIPANPTSNWPTLTGSTAQPYSDGVANYVAAGDGAITYVEASYAVERPAYVSGKKFVLVAAMKNRANRYALPSAENVAVALTRARLNPDRTQVLSDVYNSRDTTAYPISSYSYMIAKASGIDPAKAKVISRFVYYFACQGQRKAAPLGYSPLPPNLVKASFDAISSTPGADTPPAMNAKSCPNPTITGEFSKGNAEALPAAGAGGSGSSKGANSSGSGESKNAASNGSGAAAQGGKAIDTDGDGKVDAIDLDGDGQADAVDADGDGVADNFPVEQALDASTAKPISIKGGTSSVPFVFSALALFALLVIPAALLSSGAPGQRIWHRIFASK